jgi:hypothetical protein
VKNNNPVFEVLLWWDIINMATGALWLCLNRRDPFIMLILPTLLVFIASSASYNLKLDCLYWNVMLCWVAQVKI